MRKYAIVAAAILMQVFLGGVYAWSAFVQPLREGFGYTSTQTQLVFGATIACLSAAMVVTGRIQDRFGPRGLSLAAGVLLTAGYTLAGAGGNRFPVLLTAISVVNGLAVACGYVSAVATGVRWFPRNAGLISGLSTAGYGGGAILLTAVAQGLLSRGWPVLRVFTAVGLVYGPLVMLCGSLLAVPPAAANRAAARPADIRSLWRDRRFWPLVIGMFCGTYPGLTVIGNLKPIGLSYGLAATAATLAISALAVGNVSGRILWGAIQDRIGPRPATLLSLGLITLSLLSLLVARGHAGAFLVQSVFVGFCYGGSLSLYAAQTAATYGAERVGSVYSLAILFHGVAAIIAPAVGGQGFDRTGSFALPILLAAAVGLAGLAGYAALTREPRARGPRPATMG